ncbi:hypothetical protein Q7C36_006481 [Tachysurus vachellii]|uniref:Uncharacterized protein n=1 Tax=Tachysurus vachellii TaxID=175792 RepID=A0AA88SWS2_TACVA|nr:hypothetical protein Q7C36_006481 [Tachysurus vachellii]
MQPIAVSVMEKRLTPSVHKKGALLLPQGLGDIDDYELETTTAEYSTFTDYVFEYEDHTSTIDYDMYITPKQGNNNEQSNIVRGEPVHGGMNELNDKASTVYRYYAVGLGLIVQQFCQQK